MTAETSNALGEAEYEYEVWQGDALQAGGSTTDYASAQSEANHYAAMYTTDGPVEVRIYEKRLISAYKVQPKRRRYDPSGSLSEYGIFPECDAAPAAQAPRACTCHPDDRPDGPCRERYAASECQALAAPPPAMSANPIPEAVLEAVARAICVACEENPDHRGDARGNEFRWQDYRDTALAAINALTAAQQQWKAAADDMGGFSSDTAALAFLHLIGNGNPNVERAVERLRQSLIAQQPAAVDGAMVERACDAYMQIADDCMGLVRRKAMAAALTAALATQHQEPKP